MSKTRIIFSFFLVFSLLISCKDVNTKKPVIYKYRQHIIVSKSVVLSEGNTKFCFAYKDLKSEYVDFGVYANYKEGDTIHFKLKEGNFFWEAYRPK